MHTSFLHIFALAGAVIAAPAAPSVPLGPPGAGGVSSHWFGPIGGFTGPATGVSTRPFQTPTARTSAPPKSTTKTNTLATIPASSKPSSKPSSVGSAGGSSPSTAVFSIINKLGSPVSTSYIANQTPISGPGKAGVLQNNETAVLTVALNWSGNIAMSEGTPTGDDSLFEATFAPNGLDIDVSYVNGFSVPITCSCKATKEVLTGCNIDLFSYKYTNGTNYHCPCKETAKACPNPIRPSFAFDLTPDPFFQPCESAAYTWAHDDLANTQGECESNVIECCIGTDECPKNPAIPKAVATPKVGSVISNPSCHK